MDNVNNNNNNNDNNNINSINNIKNNNSDNNNNNNNKFYDGYYYHHYYYFYYLLGSIFNAKAIGLEKISETFNLIEHNKVKNFNWQEVNLLAIQSFINLNHY